MKYAGKLGIAQQTEVRPGIWEETITEHDVFGDLMQRTEALEQGDSIHPRYATSTSVSVLARSVGPTDHSSYRYLTLAGKKWVIRSAVNQHPRLILYFGEEYRGPNAQ